MISIVSLCVRPTLCPTPQFVIDPISATCAPLPIGRFWSPRVLSRIHRARPEIVVKVSYVEWTEDGLLRHVVYLGVREDKPPRNVIR